MITRDRDDEVLRAALADLGAADEADAPAFDAVLARIPAPSQPRLHVARLAIAAALVLVMTGVYQARLARRPRLTVPSEVIALSTWRPVTDALLETPGRGLLGEMPPLGASLINITGGSR